MNNAPMPTNFRITPDEQSRIAKIQPLIRGEIQELQDNITNPLLYNNGYYTYEQREKTQSTLKLIFALYYGCGLRRTEGYRLTASDIDFEKRTVFIKEDKGYKDRIVPMNKGVYNTLQDYLYNFRNTLKLPHGRLFVMHLTHIIRLLKDRKKYATMKPCAANALPCTCYATALPRTFCKTA